MAWEGSTRRQRLPPNWPDLVAFTRTRANGRCQAIMRDNTRCVEPGTDCDHIKPGDNHAPHNLQWLCDWHHARKTAHEANQAKRFRTSKRPPEKHPGLK